MVDNNNPYNIHCVYLIDQKVSYIDISLFKSEHYIVEVSRKYGNVLQSNYFYRNLESIFNEEKKTLFFMIPPLLNNVSEQNLNRNFADSLFSMANSGYFNTRREGLSGISNLSEKYSYDLVGNYSENIIELINNIVFNEDIEILFYISNIIKNTHQYLQHNNKDIFMNLQKMDGEYYHNLMVDLIQDNLKVVFSH